ncbi:MAG TPA: transposase [Bryobacteraceae bacterium]|nr:transposase [Bryobacteraceae bacterium]
MTFSSYGTHLPGAEKGWVDAKHCIPGSAMQPYNPIQEAYWKSRLNEPPFVLDHEIRLITLQAILSVCTHRQWLPHAVHIRTNHVHAVISGEATPERMLSDLKAYATRALRSEIPAIHRRRYWTNHGSTRYLWNEASLKAAIDYVLNSQGAKMAFYPPTESHPS